MKKMKLSLLLALSMSIMVGCGNNDKVETTTSTGVIIESVKEEKSVTLEIKEDNKEIKEIDVPVKEGELLGDIMADHLDIEEDNGMITSIEGHEQDAKAQKYWLYEVNGEFATVGANDYKVQPGDVITWNLAALELETSSSK